MNNNNDNVLEMMQSTCQTHTPVDSFVQLNLKPTINIEVEDYKKVKYNFFQHFLSIIKSVPLLENDIVFRKWKTFF